MTPTPSTHLPAHIYYSIIADQQDRDPIQGGVVTRATVPMGRGFGSWQRCNPDAQLVWVDDAEGRPRALTPKQALVLAAALDMIEGASMTMRDLARSLSVAPSTVSRALTKLMAFGLIAYVCGKGRFAGLVIFKRTANDGRDRFRKAAKARVRRWSEAAQRRISRLQINVAPYFLERKGSGTDTMYSYLETIVTKDATLTAQRPWTVQELREAGIL